MRPWAQVSGRYPEWLPCVFLSLTRPPANPTDEDLPIHRRGSRIKHTGTPYRRLLYVLLAVSLLLRVALVLGGGQRYWPDELRYDRSREAVEKLRRGDHHAAGVALAHPDHFLFAILGLVPATIGSVAGEDDRIPALFFSIFSVAGIAILYRLARELGESEETAFLAALLLAASAAQLYDSRHLLPYDAAMAFGLGALVVAARPTAGPGSSVLCGLLAAATLWTYNGFFLLAGCGLLIPAFLAPSRRVAARRLSISVGAFALPFAAPAALGGGHFVADWADFSRTVVQGSFAEGWRVPFAYLWHAEHLFTGLWAAAFVFAGVRLARGDRSRALVVGVAGILLIYGGLVIGSVALQKFVVYGRQVRQLIPFACVLSAVMMDRLLAGTAARRRLAVALAAGVMAQAAWNFRVPLAQVFPDEFLRMARDLPPPGGELRFILYAEFIYPRPVPVPAGIGRERLARRHPMQYLPYQYEGFTPEERAAFRAIDIRMRVVDVPD